jgi:hypothetical protein
LSWDKSAAGWYRRDNRQPFRKGVHAAAAASGGYIHLLLCVINGEPSVVAFFEGAVVSVLALSLTDHLISRVYVVSDQRKLAHVKRVLEQQA